MKRIFSLIATIISLQTFARDTIPYAVASQPWQEQLGNHRAVIAIDSCPDAVAVKIEWRRRDRDAEKKRIIITDSAGNMVRNILRKSINREEGQFYFQPFKNVKKYYVYYMPWKGKKSSGYFEGDYLSTEEPGDKKWIETNHLTNNPINITIAKVICFESRTAFDSFYPMEVIATNKEVEKMIKGNHSDFILFTERRQYPVRMPDDIPAKWIADGPQNKLVDTASKNEYFTFQVAVFASEKNLHNITVEYENNAYPVTCFNLEGRNSKGAYFTQKIDVEKGKVQPLWFGVDIPRDAKSGLSSMNVWIKADNGSRQKITLSLFINEKVLDDRGDAELWRHSRLRWLNSTLGIDSTVVAPYSPLKVDGHTITGKTGKMRINDVGLPASIEANGNEMLQSQTRFILETEQGVIRLNPSSFRFLSKKDGVVGWQATAVNNDVALTCNGTMEADGYISYKLQVVSKKDLSINDIRLELPVKQQAAKYFMGMGLPGTKCPSSYNWKWKGPQDAFWMGDVQAGLYCELRGATYSGPLLNLYHPQPPASWYNNDKGGFNISSTSAAIKASATSGHRTFTAGDSVSFEFALLITPVKKINTNDQFTNRYYHNGAMPSPSEEDLQAGIKIINVHHANPVNPYINYPFISVDSIKDFTARWHAKGLKVKMYYTIRELSDQVAELWALRSLGSEIFATGNGGGYMWLREHLVNGYRPEWFTTISGYEASDAAILTSGDSRWYNYYVEGLYWLVKNTNIDGLYLDDVAYDRNMLKRMRKVMDLAKPGCILDLHSNTGFSHGPATQYTEFFPYINKLWFGESFQYNKMPPENWLVEVSGIPFGLMGDMLHAGGNPWRGMVYGMTVRYPWFTEGVNCDPRDIWKIWDDFGIADANMKGYCDKDAVVTTSDSAVKATAFIKKDRLLIAVASWAQEKVSVQLNIDWNKIGWKPSPVVVAPAINHFQPAASFKPGEAILIEPQKGWLLIYEKNK